MVKFENYWGEMDKIVRVIKDILIILYILIMPMWLMELLGIDKYFAESEE